MFMVNGHWARFALASSVSLLKPKHQYCFTMSGEKGGVFSRRSDKRFVKQVVSSQHVPSNWVPMDLLTTECKLMEIRKYSAGYHDIDSKFRKPNLELISTYTIQNPFLLGSYNLRKEQLKMQHASVKEKVMYYPIAFDKLDGIIRHGFLPGASDVVGSVGVGEIYNKQAVAFYPDSEVANNQFPKTTNPRILIMTKVLVGICQLLTEEDPREASLNACVNSKGERVDTFTNEEKSLFLKTLTTESYPESVIVYRDKKGVQDTRSCRLGDVIRQGCVVSYRSGTRYNPDEAKFDKPDETQDGSSVGGARRKSIKASVKKSKKKPSKGNENTDPNVKSKENTVQQIEPNKDLTEQVERGVGSEIEKTDVVGNTCQDVVATVHAV